MGGCGVFEIFEWNYIWKTIIIRFVIPNKLQLYSTSHRLLVFICQIFFMQTKLAITTDFSFKTIMMEQSKFTLFCVFYLVSWSEVYKKCQKSNWSYFFHSTFCGIWGLGSRYISNLIMYLETKSRIFDFESVLTLF